jgi:hypothetical protein
VLGVSFGGATAAGVTCAAHGPIAVSVAANAVPRWRQTVRKLMTTRVLLSKHSGPA